MRTWLSRLFEKSISLPDGVPSEWAETLERVLAPIDDIPDIRTPIARDLLRYVLEGEPIEALSRAGNVQAVGEYLGVLGHRYVTAKNDSLTVYAGFANVPSGVGLRWARFLDACAGPAGTGMVLPAPRWPEALLVHAAGRTLHGWSSDTPRTLELSAETFERLLVEDGLTADTLVRAAFTLPQQPQYGLKFRIAMMAAIRGFDAALERHVETIRPLLSASAVPQRLQQLETLAKATDGALSQLADALVDMAVSSSKQVRLAADGLVRRAHRAAIVPLTRVANEGKPEQRLHALRLLHALARDENDEALERSAREIAAADRSEPVRALPGEWDLAAAPVVVSGDAVEPPAIDWKGALDPHTIECVRALVEATNESIAEQNERSRIHHAKMKAQGHNFALHETSPLAADFAASLCDYIASAVPKLVDPPGLARQVGWSHASDRLVKLAADPAIRPVALLKMLEFFGLLGERDGTLHYPAVNVIEALHRSRGGPDLLELAAILGPMGYDATVVLNTYCRSWSGTLAKDWAPEAVRGFFLHHLDRLIERFSQASSGAYWFDRSALYRAVATLPAPPAPLINMLFELALGAAKTDRPAAQAALAAQPNKEERIIAALSDGKGDTRAVAAQWLARLRHEPAIPALEAAVKKEKLDVPKGAMLDALQAFGRSIEKYLDRKGLAADAAKTLAKGLPKDIEWFPWHALPAVHWADDGEALSTELLRALIVQSVKQKSPEPNAVLRKYCATFAAHEREALGQFVLEAWLHEDVRPIEPDEAARRATAHAQSTHKWMQQNPQYFQNDPLLGKSVEEITARYLPAMMRTPAGSAIGSKGVLALAAACAGERAAGPVGRYLKEYYGTRAAQGKALIAMLAWIDHPSATQLMLSIGSRFRTKSFQEEATRQAEALAERRGWTLAELADRTIPSAGFDENGTLELSYGPRAFVAKLGADFKIELFSPEGKKIASLPEPRQTDDAELARDAKKAFSGAKKELKSIVDLQTDRLYEALCTERDWPYTDWRDYLMAHPVMRRLVQRLVWAEMDDGSVARTFRPLDDGTLTDCDDEAIEVSPTARIRVAHDSILTPEDVARWQQHLADYEVKPLFQQIGKGTYALPEDRAALTEIKDFEGHLLEAFALRGRALKLGYTRGPAEDGGWFHVYEKRFPTLGMEAVIEFTGNPLPEENRTVALLALSFTGGGGNRWERPKLALGKVPKVLLSECYNDLRLIAAEGSGYDAEWQKKSEY